MRNMINQRIVIGFAVVLIASFLYPQSSGSQWARFRGPNGQGISLDKNIPVQWSETEGMLWKTPLPGKGNSSPIVWGDRLFVQSASSDGKQRLLLCLSVVDGKTLWSRSAPGAFVRINSKNTLASSTPATDGRLVYVVFWDGASLLLSAYDFSGTLAWTRDLGGLTTQHGAGLSPVVYKDKLFLANDQDVSSHLLAFDSKTGKPLWQAERQAFNACYSTPFLLDRPGDGIELIVGSTAGISGYDPETGKEKWKWPWSFANKPLRTVSSPIHSDSIVFATSGDGGGDRHMVAVKLGSRSAGTKATLAWESTRTLPYVPSLLAWGEHLYWVNDLGIAGCHVAKTGESVWTERLGGNIVASPILVDGKIYTVNEDGEVFVFQAAPSFKLLAKNSLGELVRATPAVAGNRLFIRGGNHLFCIGRQLVATGR